MKKTAFFFDRIGRMFSILGLFFILCIVLTFIATHGDTLILKETKQNIATFLGFLFMGGVSLTLLFSQKHK